jgi:hypothetical protein
MPCDLGRGDPVLLSEEGQHRPCSRVQAAEGFRLRGRSFLGDLEHFCLRGRENGAERRQEVLDPGGQVGRLSSLVVVVMRVGRERLVVAGQIASMLLFEREKAVETVAVPLEEKGGEQARRPAVAVVVGVDGDELVVSQPGDQR